MTRRETTTAAMKRAATEHTRPPGPGWPALVLRVAGAGLLLAAGAIHLDLYLTGYRTIPTIGWLFLLQVIAAFGLGLAVLAIPGARLVKAGRLVGVGGAAAAAGAGFALATLGGYLLSVWTGLFGFKEVRTTAGLAAGLIEVAAFAVLAALTLAPAGFPARLSPAITRAAVTTAAALTVAAAALFGVVVAGANPPARAATGAGPGLRTATVGGTTVLTTARGFTVYWFAPDTPTASACYGSCAAYWPPVTGPATARPGLSGRVGTITRSGGARQLTYEGHPLYTYIGDIAPGQARGNNLNLNGGLWHDVPISR